MNNKTNATSQQVENHFSKTYKTFDSFYDPDKGFLSRWIDRVFRRSMQLRFERVVAAVAPYSGKTVLDVGCGAGRYAIVLARQGVAKVLGIDFAENMIRAAQQAATQFQVTQIVQFERADFMHLQIPQPFHHSFAMGVMDYVSEPVPFMQKMIACTTDTVMLSFPRAGGCIQWCRKHYFFKIKKCPVYFYSRTAIEELARLAGAKEFTLQPMAKDFFLQIVVNPPVQ